MKSTNSYIWIIAFILIHINCNAHKHHAFKPLLVFSSTKLKITQISENAYIHTSFLQTTDFGYVPCNGLVIKSGNETVIFDTPTDDASAEILIRWINATLQCQVKAIIPTHFHNDCLGGLKAFHDREIPSYANAQTIELATQNGYVVPQNSFNDSLLLKVGNEKVIALFLGEGHTKDNVVGYFPSEHILFGGCLIKELKAHKGYLGDANLKEWSNTVKKVKQKFSDVKIVVPGHGKQGNQKLLDYTIKLFSY